MEILDIAKCRRHLLSGYLLRVFKVKTLKPLSTLKLQQLISLMEEESFKDEEYIATEGQLGEKFFIVVLGNVRTRRAP